MTEQVAMRHDTPLPASRRTPPAPRRAAAAAAAPAAPAPAPVQRVAARVPRPPRGRMAMFRPWAFPALLLVLFEIYARRAVALGSEALAPPSAALKALAGAALDGSLWQATGFTLGTAALGLLVGALLGVGIGIVLGLSRRAARLSLLSIEVLRPVPSVALIPLAMLLFGFGVRMELGIVAFATFWPMLILVQSAVQQVEPRLLEVSQVLGLSGRERAWKIVLPAIVPRLFVALRLGVAVALVVSVTVEIAANPHGMGYAMMIAQQSLEPALMLGWLAWIGVVGFVVNAAMLRLQRAVGRRMGVAS